MAIYHLSAKIVSRSTGRSSVSAAAYRSASRLTDMRTGQDHNYTAKRDVQHSEIVTPENTPDWMRDRAALWNAVEQVEKRKDSQLCREIEVALPRELTVDRHIGMVREFVQTEFVNNGLIADFSIHAGKARDGGEQPHSHILLTTRELLSPNKDMPEWRFGAKSREWNSVDKLEVWRSRWAEHVNLELERGGYDVRIDHRTLEAQRAEAERQAEHARDAGDIQTAEQQEERAVALDREPEPKLGPTASNMEKLGHPSRRGDEHREVQARNAERRTLHMQTRELARQIADTARQVVEEARQRLHDVAERLEKAYCAVRNRAQALTGPTVSENERSPEATIAGPLTSLTNVARDALLGRSKPIARDTTEIRRSDPLGRSSEEKTEEAAPDVAALLGRGLPRLRSIKDRSRDDDDRGR